MAFDLGLPKKISFQAILGYLFVFGVPAVIGLLRGRGLTEAADTLEQAASDGGLTWKEILNVASLAGGAFLLHGAHSGR